MVKCSCDNQSQIRLHMLQIIAETEMVFFKERDSNIFNLCRLKSRLTFVRSIFLKVSIEKKNTC